MYGAVETPTNDETRAGGMRAVRSGFTVGIVAALALLAAVATFGPCGNFEAAPDALR